MADIDPYEFEQRVRRLIEDVAELRVLADFASRARGMRKQYDALKPLLAKFGDTLGQLRPDIASPLYPPVIARIVGTAYELQHNSTSAVKNLAVGGAAAHGAGMAVLRRSRRRLNEKYIFSLRSDLNALHENLYVQLNEVAPVMRGDRAGAESIDRSYVDLFNFLVRAESRSLYDGGLLVSDRELNFGDASVYLANEQDASAVTIALRDVATAYKLDVWLDGPPVQKSWFQRFRFGLADQYTPEAVLERLEKAEAALELQVLRKPMAEENESQANAVATLIQAIESQDEAVLVVGSVVVVKVGGRVAARTLTPQERLAFERDTWGLASSPWAAMEFIDEVGSRPLVQEAPHLRRPSPGPSTA